MSHGLSGALSAPIANRIYSNGRHVDTDTSAWVCKKRDGTVVPFDIDKIKQALDRCFTSISFNANGHVGHIAQAVINHLAVQKLDTPTVEDVQRLVIQQLWSEGLFEAAEHYQNYRESRRLSRLDRHVTAEQARAVDEDAKHFSTALQYYQFVSKFARWRDDVGRRETWREACTRVMAWFRTLRRVNLTDAEWTELDTSLYSMETSCAMRVLQMAGPALERCHVGAFNCAYTTLDSLRSFAELLYILMAGSGCGFSVEDRYISQLPRVKHQRSPAVKYNYKVDDSTEGWCDALLYGLEKWFDGEDVWFDVTGVRPKGARLRVKGGRASGPEPLVSLLAFARHLIMSRQGKVLTDLDCHDLACMIGKIVQVGGVRRAATISLSDLDSKAMRDAKSGNWYAHAVYRTMANNSAVYECRPDIDTFVGEFAALIKSKSGERGICNRKAMIDGMPVRRDKSYFFGMNPCGEIMLRPQQFCNLSIVVARPDDTEATLMHKVRMATYWGCMQKTATDFQYLGSEWRKNCEEEALIGVDISGHADCPLLRFGAPGRAELLRKLRQVVDETDQMLSARFGVRRSAANTCVKPSGDSAAFFDCASGCSPWFDNYIMRWVREPVTSPVAKFLLDEGVPHAVAPEDPALLVFSFLRQAPAGATTRHDMTALDQLNNWLEWKEHWAEHSVSCTVYVNDDEWPDVMAWCYRNFDRITGLSFLPRDNGIYSYAPNEAITAERFGELSGKFPELRWSKLGNYENDDQTVSSGTFACVGGSCGI